jgi:DNA-binding LacI/PurR family transcriptional regulator
MESARLPIEEIRLPSESSLRAVRSTIKEYITGHGHPDGLFCENDYFALGAYRAIVDCGLRIPDDVAIVGCDGTEFADMAEQPISVVRIPLQDMCVVAWDLLAHRIRDPDRDIQERIFAPDLVVRESSRK